MGLQRFGTPFAIERYDRYEDVCQWQEYSEYKGFKIERCYDGSRPKACFRAIDYDRDTIITGEGTLEMKDAITKYIEKVKVNGVKL